MKETIFVRSLPKWPDAGHIRGRGTAAALTAATTGVLLASAAIPAVAQTASHAKIASDLAGSLRPADLFAMRTNSVRAGQKIAATAQPRFRVLVTLNASTAQVSTMQVRVRSKADKTLQTFTGGNVLLMDATPDQIEALANDSAVAAISPDRAVAITSAALDVNRATVGADVAGQSLSGKKTTLDGSGIGVAVLDSGITPGGDLSVAGFKDFVNNQAKAYDDFGHGTHVAGIIAGSGANSSGSNALVTYKGIAPRVNLVGVKVLDSNGASTVSRVIAALDWCVANKNAYKLRVLNLSLSGGVFESYKTDPLCQAAERAVKSGLVVVAAAGNLGGVYGGVGAPANDPAVIAVGATNSRNTLGRGDDVITSYSSRGPTRFDLGVKPDLVAPGNRIVSVRSAGSTLDTLYPQTQVPNSEYRKDAKDATTYTRLSGTSMAAPSVAGAAALLIQANSSLKPNGVKAALLFSAELLSGYDPISKKTGQYNPLTQGAGELNIPGAVEVASRISRDGMSGHPSYYSVIGSRPVFWVGITLPYAMKRAHGISADNLIWGGNGGAPGTPPNPEDDQVWGSNLIWGGNGGITTGDDTPLWNDDLVWGGNLIWGGNGGAPLAIDEPGDPDLIWGSNLIWGGNGGIVDDPINPDNTLWGGAVNPPADGSGGGVWGNSIVWGSNLIWGGNGGITTETGDDPVAPFPDAPGGNGGG